MSMFDVVTRENEKNKPSRVESFISGLAQSLESGKSGLAGFASNIASGLTFGRVGQQAAAQGLDAEVVATAATQELDESIYRNIEASNNYLLAPYRYAVARPLTTALLAGNSNYNELIGDVSRVEQFRQAWNTSQKVSPGQAIVGAVGDRTWGTQGVDKINWNDENEVKSYFSHGPQKYVSWTADTALSVGADPLSLAGAGAGKVGRKLVNVPVSTKNMNKIVKDIDEAVINNVNNNWAPAVGFFKENSSNIDAIMSHSMVANNAPLATQISKTASYGNVTGDYGPLATTLKVAVGDSKTLDNLYYDDTLAAQAVGEQQAVLAKTQQVIKAFDSNLPIYNSPKPLLVSMQRKNTLNNLKQFAENTADQVQSSRSALQVLDDIVNEVTPGSLSRQTVSRFQSVERARIKNAITYSGSYWGVEQTGPLNKVLHWLNPAGKVKETPSNFAQIGNIAGDRSHVEFAARVREWGRIIKASGDEQRSLYENYVALGDKGARGQAFDDLDSMAMSSIVSKHLSLPANVGMTEHAREIITAVAEEIANNSISHRKATLSRLVDNNYMITDDFGSSVFIKALKDYEDKVAGEIAFNRSGFGADITAADIAQAKETVKNIFKNVPIGESQIPNVHFGTDLVQFDNAIAEHSVMLNDLVQELLTNPIYKNYTAADARELIKRHATLKSGEMLMSDVIQNPRQYARIGKDFATDKLDMLYNDVWKPVTLMSLKYPSRNVAEGWQRAFAIAAEYSRDFGISMINILGSAFESGVRSRRTMNKAILNDAKTAQATLNKMRTEFYNAEVLGNEKIADALFNTSDSVITTFNSALQTADDIITHYGPNGLPVRDSVLAPLYDFANTFGYRLSDVEALPSDVSPVLYNAFYTNNHNVAFEIIASLDAETTLKTAGFMQSRIRKELDTIDKIVTDEFLNVAPPGAITNLNHIQTMLGRMDLSVQNMSASVMAKASVREELETLGAKVDISDMRKAGQGEFELIPGLMMDDAYAGVMGEIMRKNVSAASSTLGAVFNVDRVVIGSILNGKVKTGLIHPYAEGSLNPAWGRVAADYANRRYRDSIVRKFNSIDASDPKQVKSLIKWAKSNDIEASRWRKSMDAQIDILESQGVPDPIAHMVQSEALFVEGTLPNYTLDGRVIAPLKDADGNFILTEAGKRIPGTNIVAEESGQLIPGLRAKALDGTLTAEDMFMIPEKQRVSVSGNIADDAKVNPWRKFTQTVFKHIGVLPEDNFVRHPVYRMIYQSEARRIVNLWKQQGRSNDWINANLATLAESSHRKAYDTVMQRLYSVERKTNPAEFLRFVSPFYMAKQNSNRFWFGYAMRNPQAVGRYFMTWSAPSRVFDVEDENGRDVEFVNPFWANGVAAKFTMPKAVTDKLGLPEGSRASVSLSSFDLINNGFVPFMPEMGSPLYDVTAGQLISATSGTALDPELLLAKMGRDPELFRKLVAPYVRSNPNIDERDIILNFMISPNAWMRSFLAGTSDVPALSNIGNVIDPSASDRLASLTNKNFKMLYVDYANETAGGPGVGSREDQAKVIADLTKQANAMAVHTLMWESFLSFGPFVGNVKVEELADVKSKELRLYQEYYGFDEGNLKFALDNTKISQDDPAMNRYGIYQLSAAQGSSRETNPFGLAGTPQTVRAIQQNRELWDIVSSAAQGGDDMPDNKILGSLFNQGDRVKDYTVTANNKLYSLGIKRPAENDEAARRAVAVDMGYDVFFAIQDKYDALAESRGIEPGSDAYKDMFGDDMDAEVAQLEKSNPIWAADSAIMNRAKADNNTKTILAVLGDEKFMNSVGKNSKLIEGLYAYMSNRQALVSKRLQLSDNRDTNIYQTNKFNDLVAEKEALAKQVSATYPEFETFYKYYLQRDPLFSDGLLAEVK